MRGKVTLVTVAIVIITLASAYSVSSSGKIVFENSVGFTGLRGEGPTGFSKLKEDLDFQGYTPTDSLELDARYEEITPQLLEKSKILVLINPIRPLSYEERNRIKEYVSGGGKLLLICDNPNAMAHANELSEDFDLKYLGRYIDDASLSVNRSNAKFYSAMPMEYTGDEEPGLYLRANTTSRTWDSYWEVGNKQPREEHLILIGLKHGKGRVAFLPDKDFLLNENYQNSSSLLWGVLNWLESGESLKLGKPSLEVSNKSLSLSTYYNLPNNFSIRLSNPGTVNESVRISVSSNIKEVLAFKNYSFEIEPSSKEDVIGVQNCTNNFTGARGELNVTSSTMYSNLTHHLPVEVSCREPEMSISVSSVSVSSRYNSSFHYRFFISNPTPAKERVDIDYGAPLSQVLSLDMRSFDLEPSSKQGVLLTVNCTTGVSHIHDYLNVTARAGGHSTGQLLPVEVSCNAD